MMRRISDDRVRQIAREEILIAEIRQQRLSEAMAAVAEAERILAKNHVRAVLNRLAQLMAAQMPDVDGLDDVLEEFFNALFD